MKLKHNIKILLITVFTIVFLLILSNKVEAASANISCSETFKINEPVTIKVTGSGVQWNLKLLVDGKQIASSSELENYDSNKNISFSGIYTPTSTEPKKVTLEGSVTEFSDGKTITSFTSKEIKVNSNNSTGGGSAGGSVSNEGSANGGASNGNTIGGGSAGGSSTNENTIGGSSEGEGLTGGEKDTPQADQKSEKATMTKVKVGDKTYTKTATKTKITASKVENDVTSINVLPTISNNESYTINGLNGNKNKGNTIKLEEGTNTIRIKLASGNEYTILIERAAKEDDTPNIIEEPALKSLLIKGVMANEEKIELSYTPEFSSEVYEYKLLLDETLSDITKLDIQTVALQEDFKVEVTGNEELKDGENIVTITVKSKDGSNTVTYKIIVTKEAKQVDEPTATISAPTVEIPQEVVSPRWNTTQKVLITLFTSIIAAMGIMYAVIEYRYTNNKEDDYEEDDDFEPYSFGKIGFKKEDDNIKTFEDEVEEDIEEPEEITFEKLEPDKDTKKEYESVDTEFESFESIKEEKPKNNKNKGRHF